jgi:hypothetical protein
MPYGEALNEMLRADGLLLMQGANCNEQIPAKLYEYFRARRPILGLADPSGDSGRTMQHQGLVHIAALENAEAIEAAFTAYLRSVRPDSPPTTPKSSLDVMSRRGRARQLAALLDAVVAPLRSESPG